MSWFRRFCLEFWGLFVDDGSHALAILLWVAIAIFVLPKLLPDEWKGPVLFLGLVAILIENVSRSAQGSPKQ